MIPDIIVMAEIALLRFGLPLLVVAGGGYLLSRYVDQRRKALGQQDLEKKAREKLQEIQRRRNRVA